MATRKPLVLVDGAVKRLPSGDTVEGATAQVNFSATNGNGGAITVGQPVYIDGAGSVDLAQANASTTARVAGLVQDASIASAGSGNIQHSGVLTSADWTSVVGSATLTAGSRYYLDAATAGQLTATPPDTTGQFVAAVGLALSTTELLIEIERPIGA
jgi:hypothetical protein